MQLEHKIQHDSETSSNSIFLHGLSKILGHTCCTAFAPAHLLLLVRGRSFRRPDANDEPFQKILKVDIGGPEAQFNESPPFKGDVFAPLEKTIHWGLFHSDP